MKTWKFLDKSQWPRGKWDGEPDKAQWIDTATSLDCLAVRQPHSGHWCGYVGVPPGHPLFGSGYDIEPHPDVHGGLTFAAKCQEDREHGICHIPEPGRPEHVWWFGFDCAHLGDISPVHDTHRRSYGSHTDTYKTLEYVKRECTKLAEQLAVKKP